MFRHVNTLFKRLFKDKKASALALVVLLITVVIVLLVGLVVVGQLATTADTFNLGTSGNATRTSLFNNIYSAFNLSVLIPIVAAAGALMAIIFAYLGRGNE